MGLEPTSLAFSASVLPLHHYTHAFLSMQLLASEVIADYYSTNAYLSQPTTFAVNNVLNHLH